MRSLRLTEMGGMMTFPGEGKWPRWEMAAVCLEGLGSGEGMPTPKHYASILIGMDTIALGKLRVT